MNKTIIIFVACTVLAILPASAGAANKTQNQIYVLCAATIAYEAMLESRTGKGPKYEKLIKIGRVYTNLVDSEFRPAIAQVVAQIENGLASKSDAKGTAANCVRWYEDDEIKDIR